MKQTSSERAPRTLSNPIHLGWTDSESGIIQTLNFKADVWTAPGVSSGEILFIYFFMSHIGNPPPTPAPGWTFSAPALGKQARKITLNLLPQKSILLQLKYFKLRSVCVWGMLGTVERTLSSRWGLKGHPKRNIMKKEQERKYRKPIFVIHPALRWWQWKGWGWLR